MSIQPVSSSSPIAEPAVQRRSAPERDAGGERESFVLPREEAAQEATTPSRESRRDSSSDAAEARRDAGNARRASGDAAVASEKPSDAAAQPAAAETGAKPAAIQTGKPDDNPGDAVPAVQPAAQNLDIAALVSIAEASQAESQTATVGKTGDVVEEMPEGELTEEDVATAVAEPKAEGVPVVSPTVVLSSPVPVLTLPTELVAGPAADPAGDGDLLSDKAGSATAAAALSLVAARDARLASPSGADAGFSVEARAVETAGTVPASQNGVTGPAETASLTAGGGQPAKVEAGPEGGEKAAQAQSPAPAQASLPSESKPSDVKSIDALQQALNPIDLSALGQQGGARPEALRIVTMPEQVVAQAPAVAQGQSATEGPPTPLHVLPIEIGLRALAGARQFEIRLDPGELGRVDVNLSISDTGEVTAKMVVDRVETLHLLQRDSRTLERAFEQAGLKPSDGGVDISLRDPSDQSGFRQNRQQDEAPQRARISATGSEAGEDSTISAKPAPASRLVRIGGVDLSI